MAIRAPTDRRFRRARVRPTRRHRLRRLLTWRSLRVAGAVVLVVVAAHRGRALVAGASWFRVDHVVVRGNERLATGEVLALLADLRGQSLLRVDLDRYRSRLLESPWVADAALRRLMPSTVEVLVAERVPICLGRIGSRLYLVDQGGVLLDEYGPQYAEFDLPIVDGLVGGRGEDPTVERQRARLASRLLADLASRSDLGDRVSQIDVTDAHDAIVLLEGDDALLHLGETRFVERLQLYVELAPALRAQVPDIDYVDLRFDERVYVRPANGPGAAMPAARRF